MLYPEEVTFKQGTNCPAGNHKDGEVTRGARKTLFYHQDNATINSARLLRLAAFTRSRPVRLHLYKLVDVCDWLRGLNLNCPIT